MRYAPNNTVISAQNDDGELTLYHPTNQAFFVLNGSGEWLWNTMSDTILSTDELVNSLTSSYDVSEAQAAADVKAFLDELQARDLVRAELASTSDA